MKATLTLSWTHNHPPFFAELISFSALLFCVSLSCCGIYTRDEQKHCSCDWWTREFVFTVLLCTSLKHNSENQQNISKSNLFDLILFTSSFFLLVFPHLLHPSVSLSLFVLACVAMRSYFLVFPVFAAVFPTLTTLKMYSRRVIKGYQEWPAHFPHFVDGKT